MRSNLWFCIGWLVVVFACDSTPNKSEKVIDDTATLNINFEQIVVYELKSHPLTDSLLMSVQPFGEFTSTITDLTKLNPLGLEPFLEEALVKCNTLLKANVPAPYNAPDIHSRLKVVKTEILKALYYSQEKKEEELNSSLNRLYLVYKAYLKRIEDFSRSSPSILQVERKESKKRLITGQ
ncbi:MAG: hypothetical protein ACPIB2_00115 [Flavobacteriaceae bacterium]